MLARSARDRYFSLFFSFSSRNKVPSILHIDLSQRMRASILHLLIHTAGLIQFIIYFKKVYIYI